MGRGLLGFIILGQRRATYDHWDSYPDGVGPNIVNFILNLKPEGYATMARLVAEITWVNSESKPSLELQERYQKSGFSDIRVGNQTFEDWYCLLRKTQGVAALPAIQSGQLKHMVEAPLEDDDCDWEWAHFIDFDKHMLETWWYDNDSEAPLDIVSFEKLVEDGVEGYVERVNKLQEDIEF